MKHKNTPAPAPYEILADERLDVAEYAVGRLLAHLKSKPLTGTALEQMKHVEQAAQHLELARLVGTGAPAWRDRLAQLRSQIASDTGNAADQADAIAAALRATSNLRGARQAFERVESMMSSVTYSHGGRRWILTVSAIPEEL